MLKQPPNLKHEQKPLNECCSRFSDKNPRSIENRGKFLTVRIPSYGYVLSILIHVLQRCVLHYSVTRLLATAYLFHLISSNNIQRMRYRVLCTHKRKFS